MAWRSAATPLELAPKFTLLADADASYLWSVRVDPKGTLYAAGVRLRKSFRFDSNGKPAWSRFHRPIRASDRLRPKGTLYVALLRWQGLPRPASGEKSIFFDPKTKYIWDLPFRPTALFMSLPVTKDRFSQSRPTGKGDLFYSSDEAHIRVDFDAKGNLIAAPNPAAASYASLRVLRELPPKTPWILQRQSGRFRPL